MIYRIAKKNPLSNHVYYQFTSENMKGKGLDTIEYLLYYSTYIKFFEKNSITTNDNPLMM